MNNLGCSKGLSFVGGGFLALLLFLLAILGIKSAGAAEVDEPTIRLEEMEVTAEEEDERAILDLEQSFEESFIREKVFSEKIESESISDVKAAMKALPNVTVRELGAYTKTIEIRGLSGDRVIAVVDGVRLSNQGMSHNGGGDINQVDINTVDSIEVIKGSPAVIYDPGATGGIILVETKQIADKDHLKLKTRFAYDEGLDQKRYASYFSGAAKGFGIALSYSQSDADGYQVRNKAKLQEVIKRTNAQGSGLSGANRLTDLGFEEESLVLNLSYRISKNQSLSFQQSDYEAEDITFIAPGAVDTTLFHIKAKTRESQQLRYQINKIGIFRDIKLAYANQDLLRDESAGRSLLQSRSITSHTALSFLETKWVIGGEMVIDEADTQVFSDQDYYAGYVSAEHRHNKFTYLAGIRLNQWEVKAKLEPGRDAEIAGDLVGVSGNSAPKKEKATTYASGLVYALNENNNISLNYSRTHRAPSLMERFAFGNFTGGGLSLQAEEADNIDAAWKYYDGLFSASLSIFYSDFENYISVKQRRRITNAAAFETCIRQGKCDPANGEFDGREDEFFSEDFPYFNVKRVVNQGFEVSLTRVREKDYETGLSFALSDFDVRAGHSPSDVKLVLSDSNPLEFNFHYKRYFSEWSTAPWAKINARYVTNMPSVSQEDGFSAFLVVDFYAGFKYVLHDHSDLIFNAGIRNLSDKVYHEPFSPLDGLKRSFFFNISFELA